MTASSTKPARKRRRGLLLTAAVIVLAVVAVALVNARRNVTTPPAAVIAALKKPRPSCSSIPLSSLNDLSSHLGRQQIPALSELRGGRKITSKVRAALSRHEDVGLIMCFDIDPFRSRAQADASDSSTLDSMGTLYTEMFRSMTIMVTTSPDDARHDNVLAIAIPTTNKHRTALTEFGDDGVIIVTYDPKDLNDMFDSLGADDGWSDDEDYDPQDDYGPDETTPADDCTMEGGTLSTAVQAAVATYQAGGSSDWREFMADEPTYFTVVGDVATDDVITFEPTSDFPEGCEIPEPVPTS